MRFYVATAFTKKVKARAAMRQLEEAGHIITHDWTKHKSVKKVSDLTAQMIQDLAGVAVADVFVLLWPGRYTSSAELGAAIAFRKYVYVVGKVKEYDILRVQGFLSHPLVRIVPTLAQVIKEAAELRK